VTKQTILKLNFEQTISNLIKDKSDFNTISTGFHRYLGMLAEKILVFKSSSEGILEELSQQSLEPLGIICKRH
jgi:hypothetical protein